MKDEIKEILDKLSGEPLIDNCYFRLFKEDRDKLFDYITNSQEQKDKEIERLNNINDELYNLFCQLDSEIMKRDYAKANKINFIIRNKLKELKKGK